MAIGDSITAAYGMVYHQFGDNPLIESRGKSFSIGDEPGAATIPNFLESIGAGQVKGASNSETMNFVFAPICLRTPFRNFKKNQLNAAISSSHLDDIDEQIDYLESSISKVTPKIDMDDWKLITFFVGGNDICESCKGTDRTTPHYWSDNYYRILSKLRDKFPRLVVNVVLLPDASPIGEIGKGEKEDEDH
eukprot:gene8652-10152_t